METMLSIVYYNAESFREQVLFLVFGFMSVS